MTSLLAACLGCETTGLNRAGPGRTGSDEEVWSIRCITLNTPDRFESARMYADALRQVPGLDPRLVQVISDEESTAVFYGRYRRIYDADSDEARFKPDHLQDLNKIQSLRLQNVDVWPFILATMDVLSTYESTHPEWNLENASGYWSLHVGVFYNTGEFRSRRSAAERYCEILRERGEEAYFHHGTSRSSVYVGTYPQEAVTEIRREDPLSGRLEVTNRIVDPQMLAAQERFPHSLHNGHLYYEVTRARGEATPQRTPAPSFPVIIPRAEALPGLGGR